MNKYLINLVLFPLVLCASAACALDSELFSADDSFAHHSKSKSSVNHHVPAEPSVDSGFVKMQVAFVPWDDAETMIVKALDKAREQILVQAYVLSNKEIIAALLRAHARHIDVRVLVDETQMQRRVSRVVELVRADIPVRLERRYHSAHNKLMVIDPERPFAATVITGSMNYSDASPHRNAENVLIISEATHLARKYAKNWQRHAQQAVPYQDARCRKQAPFSSKPVWQRQQISMDDCAA